MQEITLTRIQSSEYATFGKIDCPIFKSHTMERSKDGEYPCIPVGKYRCTAGVSPHFYEAHADYGFGRGVVYHVLHVPGREHILIHPANWPSQLKGCIALGSAVANVEVYSGLLSSRAAVKAFMSAMKGEDFILNIIEG